jgi:group I intron endonuclease
MVGIYKITSLTGKVYIGQSRNIKDREKDYITLQCKGQVKLYNSLQRYGWQAHKFEVVHELPGDITQEILDIYEVLYWKQYKDCGIKMLNLKEPGHHGKHSEETRRKMSISGKKKVFTEEHRRNMSKAWTGRKIAPFSEEHKHKLAEAKKGRTLSEEVKSKIANSMRGKIRGSYKKKQ